MALTSLKPTFWLSGRLLIFSALLLLQWHTSQAKNFEDLEQRVSSYSTNLDDEKLKLVLGFVAEQKDIPFAFADEGCTEKAFELSRRLEFQLGIKTMTIKIEPVATPYLEEVQSPNLLRGKVSFRHHVATVIVANGKALVLDLSFYPGPVSLGEWVERFAPSSSVKSEQMRIQSYQDWRSRNSIGGKVKIPEEVRLGYRLYLSLPYSKYEGPSEKEIKTVQTRLAILNWMLTELRRGHREEVEEFFAKTCGRTLLPF